MSKKNKHKGNLSEERLDRKNDQREFSDKTAQKSTAYVPCAHSHPALDLGNGLVVYGGKAYDPIVKDADIYVSLDQGKAADPRSYPWNGGQFIYFPITDMDAPKSPEEFKKLITWMADQIKGGHKVHVGCIGGHGRTGTVFAALAKELTGNVDAIQYVREKYCEKAVESNTQVEFLVKHYGVTKVKATKSWDAYDSGKGGKKDFYQRYPEYNYQNDYRDDELNSFKPRGDGGSSKRFNDLYVKKESDVAVVEPKKIKGNVWGLDSEEPAPAVSVDID